MLGPELRDAQAHIHLFSSTHSARQQTGHAQQASSKGRGTAWRKPGMLPGGRGGKHPPLSHPLASKGPSDPGGGPGPRAHISEHNRAAASLDCMATGVGLALSVPPADRSCHLDLGQKGQGGGVPRRVGLGTGHRTYRRAAGSPLGWSAPVDPQEYEKHISSLPQPFI